MKRGEVIFKEGDIANRIYIIKSGQVELSQVLSRSEALAEAVGAQKVRMKLAILQKNAVFGDKECVT